MTRTLQQRLHDALDQIEQARTELLADTPGRSVLEVRTPDGGWPGIDLLIAEAALLRALADLEKG